MTTESSSWNASVGKNVNIYWVAATALAVWFLFIHSPPILIARNVLADAPFLLHLTGAYSIYMACIFNTLVTPSIKRGLHIWVGRVGMILGVIGFISGLYLCWWPWRQPLPPLSFSIGITIGGVAQIVLQIRGYRSIRLFQHLREQLSEAGKPAEASTLLVANVQDMELDKKKALRTHIESMIQLFVIACGVPAGMRAADLLGIDGPWVGIGMVAIFIFLSQSYENAFLARL